MEDPGMDVGKATDRCLPRNWLYRTTVSQVSEVGIWQWCRDFVATTKHEQK